MLGMLYSSIRIHTGIILLSKLIFFSKITKIKQHTICATYVLMEAYKYKVISALNNFELIF